MLKRWLAHFTDGLFGYRLRYRRWRRWPLLVVLGLVWTPLALCLAMLLRDLLTGEEPWSSGITGSLAGDLASAGCLGQALVAMVILIFLPLFASGAFAREKAARNMVDLVLLPIERRRLVLGRLGRVLLPFMLLVVWSLPAYVATPVRAKRVVFVQRGMFGSVFFEPLPLIRMTLSAPVALTWSLAAYAGGGPVFGNIWYDMDLAWGWASGHVSERTEIAAAYIGTIVPFLTMLSLAFLLAVCGVYFSLHSRTWFRAAVRTYALVLGVLFLEMVPFIIVRDGLGGGFFTCLLVASAIAWRVVLPAFILRSAIRNFDCWALGEK